jgi:hypothetical protein
VYSAPSALIANGVLLALITAGVAIAGKAKSLRDL